MAFTHIQTHSRTHIDNWALQEHKEGHTHTDTHGHSGIDSVCEANSFCHKWSQIGSGQSPITPHLVWPQAARPHPLQHAHTHLQHTHVYTRANAPSHTQVASQRHRSGHQCRHTQTDIPRVLLIVTLSRWDHSYWFRKTGHSDQCYLLICSVIRADPECQNIWLSSFPLRKEEEITCLISGINSGRRCRRAPEQGHLYVIWVYLCLHPPLCYKGAVLDIS